MDDASCFLDIRLGPKRSVYEKHVSVKSTVTGCDVTNCATTMHGFIKQQWSIDLVIDPRDKQIASMCKEP